MNQELTADTSLGSLCQSQAARPTAHRGRFTSAEFREILIGSVTRYETLARANIELERSVQAAQTLLRKVKDRLANSHEPRIAFDRLKDTRVYLHPTKASVIVCDATGFPPVRERIYAPLNELPVGGSVVLSPRGSWASVLRSITAVQRKALIDLGWCVKFHAEQFPDGRVKITRLQDDAWAAREDDPRLEQLVQQELAEQ